MQLSPLFATPPDTVANVPRNGWWGTVCLRQPWHHQGADHAKVILDDTCSIAPLAFGRHSLNFRESGAALDALVLKALAIVLSRKLDLPRRCYHVPSKGREKRGAKAAV